MNKKIKSIIFTRCLIIPCMFMFNACGARHKIEFMVDGQVYYTIETSGNEEMALPKEPFKAGYKFGGWYYEGLIEEFDKDILKNKPLNKDLTVYAKFLAYKVGFYIDNNLVGYLETAGNEALDLSIFNTSTYTVNWYFDEQFTQEFTANSLINTTMTQDINVYGKVVYNTYSISFNSNGGSDVDTIYKHYGEGIGNLPEPTKEHYKFDGWYTDNTFTTKFTNTIMPKENKTLYAKYTPIDYNITYLLDGGIGNSNNPQTYNIESQDIVILAPWYSSTSQDSIFLGWEYNGQNVGKLFTIQSGLYGNIELKALWKTFDILDNGDSVIFNGLTEYGKDNKDTITQITITKDITEITAGAFAGCTSLETLNFESESSLKTIGERAFSNCNLSSITIPESVTDIGNRAFSDNGNLTEVKFNAKECNNTTNLNTFANSGTNGFVLTIGIDVSQIPDCLFYGSNVTEVSFAEKSVCKIIGKQSFDYCTMLSNFEFIEGLTTINDYAFQYTALEEITIPSSLTYLSSAFNNCSNIKTIYYNCLATLGVSLASFKGSTDGVSVIIGKNVTAIADDVFSNSSIKNLTFEEGSICTAIGKSSFYNCDNLTDIHLPESVLEIGDYAFAGCGSVTTITIPKSLQQMTRSTFANLTKVEVINFNATLCNYTEDASAFSLVGSETLNGTTIKIGVDVQEVPKHIFSNNNSNIVCVEFLGNNLTKIGGYAFWGNKLTSIIIPESVLEIGDYAFAGNQTLKTIIINSSYIASTLKGIGTSLALEYNAETVYIKTGLNVSSAFLNSFVKNETTDKDGYDKYILKTIND